MTKTPLKNKPDEIPNKNHINLRSSSSDTSSICYRSVSAELAISNKLEQMIQVKQ